MRLATAGDFGFVVWLMSHSDLHRKYSVHECVSLILAPIELGQAIISEEHKAYGSWAFLSDVQHDVMKKRGKPVHWKDGHNVWAMDIIAPFGGAKHVMRHMIGLARENGVGIVHFSRQAKGQFGRHLHV